MKCSYHPDRRAETECVFCGKILCDECVIMEEHDKCCKDCLSEGRHPIGVREMILPALLPGAFFGFCFALFLGIGGNCPIYWLMIAVGMMATLYLKNSNDIKGKLSKRKAAFTGVLTSFFASAVMWGTRLFAAESYSSLWETLAQHPIIENPTMLFTNHAEIYIALTTIFLAIFGALGALVCNEIKW